MSTPSTDTPRKDDGGPTFQIALCPICKAKYFATKATQRTLRPVQHSPARGADAMPEARKPKERV